MRETQPRYNPFSTTVRTHFAPIFRKSNQTPWIVSHGADSMCWKVLILEQPTVDQMSKFLICIRKNFYFLYERFNVPDVRKYHFQPCQVLKKYQKGFNFQFWRKKFFNLQISNFEIDTIHGLCLKTLGVSPYLFLFDSISDGHYFTENYHVLKSTKKQNWK